jgi:catechol 2,3-dioxygenase-like lactoylglutathione lyase family enzyme
MAISAGVGLLAEVESIRLGPARRRVRLGTAFTVERNLLLTPQGILEAALYAEDLEAAEGFYSNVLHLELLGKQPSRHVSFRCGQGVLLLFNPQVTSVEGTHIGVQAIPLHGTTGPGHIAFRVEEHELEKWREQLRTEGVPIESEVAWPKGGHSIYCRDPAGNSLELATPAVWGMSEQK